MKFSRYVFQFKVDNDVIALYHALLIRTVFLSNQEINEITEILNNGTSLNSGINRKTIEYLFENYYIVNDDNEDSLLYEKCLSLISEPAISNAYIVVTENCNFNCKYCFISEAVQKENTKSKVMTEEVARKAVALLQKTYERQKHDYDKTITFYGGEPLMNVPIIEFFLKQIEEVKKTHYWPSDVKYALITNGALLTPKIIDFLKANNINLSISYDITKSSHAQRVNKSNPDNSYDIVSQKIDLCKQMDMPFSLSITITEELLEQQEEVIKSIERINPATIAYNLLIPNQNTSQDDRYYELATTFMLKSFELLRDTGLYEDRIMRKVHSFSKGRIHLYDCCASGGNQFVIAPDGQIGICHGYLNNRKFFSSSVFDDDFDFKTQKDYLYWKDRTPLLMPQCQNCECLSICGGGCPYAAEKMYGTIYNTDTRFCIHAKNVLFWLIKDLYKNCKAI